MHGGRGGRGLPGVCGVGSLPARVWERRARADMCLRLRPPCRTPAANRRRLELFGHDHNLRDGWVTAGLEISPACNNFK